MILIAMLSLGFNGSRSQTIIEEGTVPMRDAVKFHTKIWRSARFGSYNVVLTKGYWCGSEKDSKRFNKAGYVYVGQSTRGHKQSEGSDGVANRFFDGARDGSDTELRIAHQAIYHARNYLFHAVLLVIPR